MADYTGNYDDLDYGDEVRGEAVQTVSFDHEASESGPDYSGDNDPDEGMVVGVDANGHLKAATTGDSEVEGVGVLYTYQYFGDSSGSGPKIRTDRKATVAVGGKLKVNVESGVAAGDTLAEGTTAGVLAEADDATANFVAVTDAVQQGSLPDGTDAYYAEVLLR